jgi:two-component system CheB/CheR fusion protein
MNESSSNSTSKNYVEEHSAEKLQAILDTAVDGVISINHQGKIETFNPGAERIFGYKAIEVRGRNISVLMPSPFREEHNDYLLRYQKTGQAHIIGVGREVKGLRKNGQEFPLDLSVGMFTVDDEQVYVGILRDLTEKKDLQQLVVTQSERQRAELGQDMHDVLAQQLAALTLLTTTLRKQLEKEGRSHVQQCQELLLLSRDAMQEARRLSHGLFPTSLNKMGLIGAFKELVENYERVWNMNIKLDTNVEDLVLKDETSLHLYRIAQEALTNASRHGQASRVDVRLYLLDNTLQLLVEDNGVGIQDTNIKGMGLSIMKYRTGLLGGSLEINSAPGRGCTVCCEILTTDNIKETP